MPLLASTTPHHGMGLKQPQWSKFNNAAGTLKAGELAVLDLGCRAERTVATAIPGDPHSPWANMVPAEPGDERHGIWLVAKEDIDDDGPLAVMYWQGAPLKVCIDSEEVKAGELFYAPHEGVLATLEPGSGAKALGRLGRTSLNNGPHACIFSGMYPLFGFAR